MKVQTLTNRTYELADVSALLASKNKEFCFRILSAFLFHLNNEDYQKYVNFVQFIPALINSFLLYANGEERDISEEEFNQLVVMISSLDVESSSLNGTALIYQSYLKVLRNIEHTPLVLGRIGYIFNWLKENKDQLEFKEVTKLELEDVMLVFWGAFSLNDSGNGVPLIDPNIFFSTMKLDAQEIEFLVKNIDESFSIDLKNATDILKNRLIDKNKQFDSYFTSFEDKPFLKINNSYLLLAPHFAINNLISICSKFFIEQYSPKVNNEASTFYGHAFESYCSELLTSTLRNLEFEPIYKNAPNEKGPDAIFIKKGKIPILFEFHKSTVYKSLYYDFSLSDYKEFLQKKVIKKFEQMFKWIKSHDYKYNSVDLLAELNRIQFVLVIAQPLPLTCFDEIQNIILELLNDKWIEVTGQSSKLLKFKNIYVLGICELEVLVGLSNLKNEHLPLKLFEYKRYLKSNPDVRQESYAFELRQEFESWLMEDVSYQDLKIELNTFFNKEIFKKMLSRINVEKEVLSAKLEKFDAQ